MRAWLFVVLLLSACSDSSPQTPVDAGPPPEDDAGPKPVDGGEPDSGEPEPDAQVPSNACDFVKSGVAVGRLAEPELNEASGLAASRRHPGVLWSHNDSGDEARLFAFETDGDALATLTIEGAAFDDWEDIAVGPGPDELTYLYVGDIGDNKEERTSVQIYRIEEPARLEDGSFASDRATAHRVDVTYEDAPHDAETLLVDPLTGDVYIVTKGALLLFDAPVPVYRVAAADLLGATATASRVGTVPLGPATGGDVSPDGTGIALRNYTHARFFRRDPAKPLETAFALPPCELPLDEALGEQGEALGFAADGAGYYTTSEGKRAPLRYYDFK